VYLRAGGSTPGHIWNHDHGRDAFGVLYKVKCIAFVGNLAIPGKPEPEGIQAKNNCCLPAIELKQTLVLTGKTNGFGTYLTIDLIYNVVRNSTSVYRLLANEKESIYGHFGASDELILTTLRRLLRSKMPKLPFYA
jgi:hypothetical protein